MNILLKNTDIGDIFIQDGIIKSIGSEISSADKIYYCTALTVLPSFLDLHTHLREPGFCAKEDIDSGLKAAAAGGYFGVLAMPNTSPAVDNEFVLEYVKNKADKAGYAKMFPIAAITQGLEGDKLTEMFKLSETGAVAFSNDGNPVFQSQTMLLAMKYAKTKNLLIISHSEDKSLSAGGVMNEGKVSCKLGLSGITRAAEEVGIARDIILAETTGCRLHIAHVSTKGAVQLVRDAKKRGVNVSAETCPHYFAGTEELVGKYNTFAKVNPPLREESDRLAVIEGLKDGTIDAIATDHAPHTLEEKNREFDVAPFGISGLETAFSLSYTVLVKSGIITLKKLAELMSINPCKISGIDMPEIKTGNKANITLCDLNKKFKINPDNFFSKGKNTPFKGKEVYGKVMMTFNDGILKFYNGEIL